MRILFGILFIAMGILNIVLPEAGWKMKHFLTVEGGEPSDFYLVFARVLGVVSVIVGILFLFGVLG